MIDPDVRAALERAVDLGERARQLLAADAVEEPIVPAVPVEPVEFFDADGNPTDAAGNPLEVGGES